MLPSQGGRLQTQPKLLDYLSHTELLTLWYPPQMVIAPGADTSR